MSGLCNLMVSSGCLWLFLCIAVVSGTLMLVDCNDLCCSVWGYLFAVMYLVNVITMLAMRVYHVVACVVG